MDFVKRTIAISILTPPSSASISAAVLVLLLEIATSKCWRQKGENLLGQSKIHKGQVGGCQ